MSPLRGVSSPRNENEKTVVNKQRLDALTEKADLRDVSLEQKPINSLIDDDGLPPTPATDDNDSTAPPPYPCAGPPSKTIHSGSTRRPVLTLSFPIYVLIGLAVAGGICCTVNGVLARTMYAPEKYGSTGEYTHPTKTFSLPPNTLAGDAFVTCLVQVLLTHFLSGGLAMRDAALNGFPLYIVVKGDVGREGIFYGTVARVAGLMPRQFALLGPYWSPNGSDPAPAGDPASAGDSGGRVHDGKGSPHGTGGVYVLPVKARLLGNLKSSLRLCCVVWLSFWLPLVLALYFFVEQVGKHTWDRESIVLFKIIPFGVLEVVLQFSIASKGFLQGLEDAGK